jgi:hypothetical protein
MMLQVQHPVIDWYLAFDDLWEVMRVNWQTHNPFTQSGMWDVGESRVLGVVMVVDQPPFRGVVLRVENDDIVDHVAIVTYGPKCQECGFQPYDALWFGGEDRNESIGWGGSVITDLIDNAEANPPERLHTDECSHLVYPDDDDPAD